MNTLQQEKEKFLKWQFFILTISAGFGRADVYKDTKEIDPKIIEKRKTAFKNTLFYALNALAETPENFRSEGCFISSIKTLIHQSTHYDDILLGGKLRFGIAQKIVNLYLKYLWCAGFLKYTPLHFPLDRLIQKGTKITNWTDLDDEKEYLKKINELYPQEDKAEWELVKYNNEFYK